MKLKTKTLKKLYGLFLWMGFNYLKATEPLRGVSVLFTTKFPEILGTDLIEDESTESTLEPPTGFEQETPGLEIQRLLVSLLWTLNYFTLCFTVSFFCFFFWNCYLAVPRPTLGHSRGDSLINPMLITAFSSSSTRRSRGTSRGDWVPKPGRAPSGV